MNTEQQSPSNAGPELSSRLPLTGERSDESAAALPDFSGLPIHESGFPIIEIDIDPAEVMILQREMIERMSNAVVEAGKMCAKARKLCDQTGNARHFGALVRRCAPRSR